jgi:hypothetical protein
MARLLALASDIREQRPAKHIVRLISHRRQRFEFNVL